MRITSRSKAVSVSSNSLNSWHALSAALKVASEDECWELLKAEQAGKGRAQFLIRIHGRACKLRTIRERNALMDGSCTI